MSKRKRTNMELYEPEIIRLREAGLTRQQIADELFLEKVQIKNWINRYNKRQSVISERTPKPKGRPRKDGKPPKQNIESELKRLRMENKLLRDFLLYNHERIQNKTGVAPLTLRHSA